MGLLCGTHYRSILKTNLGRGRFINYMENHNTLGILAAERCASIIQSALLEQQRQHLHIRAFSTPQVKFNGKSLLLTPRQIEILTILALCPHGLTLEHLYQALYGERKVSMGTLKAEMSQLRDILGGLLGSRPYRLLVHVEADFYKLNKRLMLDMSPLHCSFIQAYFWQNRKSVSVCMA